MFNKVVSRPRGTLKIPRFNNPIAAIIPIGATSSGRRGFTLINIPPKKPVNAQIIATTTKQIPITFPCSAFLTTLEYMAVKQLYAITSPTAVGMAANQIKKDHNPLSSKKQNSKLANIPISTR